MNFGILPDDMLETIHEAINDANDEPDKHGVEDSPEWKEWRDTIEGEMTKRGIEFEHIVLAGEEEEEGEGADEGDEKDENDD